MVVQQQQHCPEGAWFLFCAAGWEDSRRHGLISLLGDCANLNDVQGQRGNGGLGGGTVLGLTCMGRVSVSLSDAKLDSNTDTESDMGQQTAYGAQRSVPYFGISIPKEQPCHVSEIISRRICKKTSIATDLFFPYRLLAQCSNSVPLLLLGRLSWHNTVSCRIVLHRHRSKN